MTEILVPSTPEQLDAVRHLMRAFIAWHHERHHDQLDLVKGYFDERAFEEELAGLPGKYTAPEGALLLAAYEGEPAGCVALRRIDAGSCEMKRMFVYSRYHGKGIGRALGQAIVDLARERGYRRMLLDSGAKQHEAHALYRSLGFRDIAPYYDLPPDLRDWLVYMSLDL